MSYLDYFLKNTIKFESQENANKAESSQKTMVNWPDNNNGIDKSANNPDKIHGTCHTMCPFKEEQLRTRERMIHVLEKCGTDLKLVKSYSRSAADTNMAVPQNLRPFNILRVTVAYLLLEVTKRTDIPTPAVYDFLNDRLRAVRQDMTIQRLSYRECAHLLEPMIRFYVYYGYRLHGLPLNDFDPVLHKKYLLECLKWFLNCCDNTKDLGYGDEQLTASELSDLMATMDIEAGSHSLVCDQVLMESLYLLCNLDDIHPLRRYVNLPLEYKREQKLKQAFTIAFENRKGNFVKVTKMLSGLCPLLHCALCQYLPELQRRAFGVLSRAYSNQRLSVPGAAVRRWLAFSSEEEALAACRHYGLEVKAGAAAVRFEKGMLNTDVKMHESNIRLLKDDRLNLSLPHVFTYTTK